MDSALRLVALTVLVGHAQALCPTGVVAPCECVVPQNNVTWDQISGKWYLVQSSPSSGISREVCFGIIISPTLKAGFEKSQGEEPSFVNVTLVANTPSSWYESNLSYYTHVAYFSETLSSLVLVSCVPIFSMHFQWIGIFNREPTTSQLTINTIHDQLINANLSAIENPKNHNNIGCRSN